MAKSHAREFLNGPMMIGHAIIFSREPSLLALTLYLRTNSSLQAIVTDSYVWLKPAKILKRNSSNINSIQGHESNVLHPLNMKRPLIWPNFSSSQDSPIWSSRTLTMESSYSCIKTQIQVIKKLPSMILNMYMQANWIKNV